MVLTCCVIGCKSESYKGSGVSFHRFPKNEDMNKRWLNVIPANVTKHSSVCSLHFTDEDFATHPAASRRMLKVKAIPSIFPDNKHRTKLLHHISKHLVAYKPMSEQNEINKMEELTQCNAEKNTKETCKKLIIIPKTNPNAPGDSICERETTFEGDETIEMNTRENDIQNNITLKEEMYLDIEDEPMIEIPESSDHIYPEASEEPAEDPFENPWTEHRRPGKTLNLVRREAVLRIKCAQMRMKTVKTEKLLTDIKLANEKLKQENLQLENERNKVLLKKAKLELRQLQDQFNISNK